VPGSLLRRFSGTDILIPYYHVVADEPLPHVHHLYEYKSTRQFRDDLDCLLRSYSPLGLSELLALRRNGRPLPGPSFLLTFDDGYREMYDVVAPILREKGVSATFFVNSAFTDNKELCYLNKASLIVEALDKQPRAWPGDQLGGVLATEDGGRDRLPPPIASITHREQHLLDDLATRLSLDCQGFLASRQPYLTSDQIGRLIRDGFTIGGHSIDHPVYSLLSVDDQLHQTIESVGFVKERFNLDYGVFAFPFSDHGVSAEFFTRLAASRAVDLSFGTAGLKRDTAPNHLHRFSLEKPIDTADRILAYQHARTVGKRLLGRNTVTRR
jgi:peptidoglycan/xylan/chitin deacetylase (PgdA/CDA1 family)